MSRHKAYVALYGIDLPGLTASLAIGEYVADMVPGLKSNRHA